MISVVVCTRNRAESLRRTLHSLHAMAIPPALAWEVVVVDNGSGDHTRRRDRGNGPDHGDAGALSPREPSRGCPARATPACGPLAARSSPSPTTTAASTSRWLAQIDAEFGADTSLAVLGGRVELHDPSDQPVSVRRQRERTHGDVARADRHFHDRLQHGVPPAPPRRRRALRRPVRGRRPDPVGGRLGFPAPVAAGGSPDRLRARRAGLPRPWSAQRGSGGVGPARVC